MRRYARPLVTLLGAAALTAVLAAPAAAATSRVCRVFPWLCNVRPPTRPVGTPEIDPGMLRGTLTVLVGGMLILLDRRRGR